MAIFSYFLVEHILPKQLLAGLPPAGIAPFLSANVTGRDETDRANRPPNSRPRPPHAHDRLLTCPRRDEPRCDFIGRGDGPTCSCLLVFKFQAGVCSRVKYETFAAARH